MKQKNKRVLVAHYDPSGQLGKDWCEFLRLMKREAFADLKVVSTGLDLAAVPEDLSALSIVVRENVGYDFFSWRHAILETVDECAETILINNSFHILDPLKFCDLLRQPMPAGRQVEGLTVSWQKSFHAQSYFLRFGPEVTRSEVFKRFWREMRPISDRQAVIDTYELGLSRELGRAFTIEPIMRIDSYEKFLAMQRALKDPSMIKAGNLDRAYEQLKVYLNPSILLWESLLFRYGIIKRQVINENPFNLPIDELRKFIALYIS